MAYPNIFLACPGYWPTQSGCKYNDSPESAPTVRHSLGMYYVSMLACNIFINASLPWWRLLMTCCKEAAKARGLLCQFQSFDIDMYFSSTCSNLCLATNELSFFLQAVSIDFGTYQRLLDNVSQTRQDKRIQMRRLMSCGCELRSVHLPMRFP